jgi:hypothetical protein
LKAKYERECHRREILQQNLIELEKELQNKQRQSKLLGQLQTDVERLHLAFNALEVRKNDHLIPFYYELFLGGKCSTQCSIIYCSKNSSFVSASFVST